MNLKVSEPDLILGTQLEAEMCKQDIQHLVSGARGRGVYEHGDPDYGIWSCG